MSDRFHMTDTGIAWKPRRGKDTPHHDHVEMSGRLISVILHWQVDVRGAVSLVRRVYWPTLRGVARQTNGYLCREFSDSMDPALMIDGLEQRLASLLVEEIVFDGCFRVRHRPHNGIVLERQMFPDPVLPALCEVWTLRNVGDQPRHLALGEVDYTRRSQGCAGNYIIRCQHQAREQLLAPGEEWQAGYSISAGVDQAPVASVTTALSGRQQRIRDLTTTLRFACPDPILNRLFAFCCLRAGEALFATKQGLVHSPCGNSFYGGVWANDQVEYAGPFFAHLGDADAIHASRNAYRIFARAMKPDFSPIPSSFEVEGDRPYVEIGDRGDAAMYLSGCSRFVLGVGAPELAAELWPALQWCAEYCRRQTDEHGVVRSKSDELEGRFPSGDANLSTSSLAYDGYRHAALVARDLGHHAAASDYSARTVALAEAIETHFGAEVEGFATYRYFDGCTVLRSWICLPLTMGLHARAAGTLDALFSPRLWTADGLATQAGDSTFWDRATLFGLRGACAAGACDRALPRLSDYARRRLLGDHVPYPVEAYPEGGQAHLSAESALFARIITEGLFGLQASGLGRGRIQPHLPANWDHMQLSGLALGGQRWDLRLERRDKNRLGVLAQGPDGARHYDIAHGEAVDLA